MFDFAWSEIVLIGAVALIAIGPKDMPAAIRTVSSMVKKARRMAAEFQTHVDEMVREADLGDVKKVFNDIRNIDLSSAIEKHVDPDRSIRNTFADNPLEPNYAGAGKAVKADTPDATAMTFPDALPGTDALAGELVAGEAAVGEAEAEPQKPLAPAFIPPNMVPPPEVAARAAEAEVPAFIPPEAVLQRHAKT
jgi:sec-independent protein translocase protein TatB